MNDDRAAHAHDDSKGANAMDNHHGSNRDEVHDNVRPLRGRLHDTNTTADHERVQDSVHDAAASIVHETSERVELGDVHDLAEAEMIDGGEAVILTAEESAALDERLAGRGTLVRRAVVSKGQAAGQVAVRVVKHDRTKTGGKAVIRAGYQTAKGAESYARRAWDASTMGVYRRQIKAAEASGDQEALRHWTALKETATDRRHGRLMDLPKLAFGVLKVAVGTMLATPVVLFIVAVFAKITGAGSFTGVWAGFFAAIGFVITAGGVVWSLLTMLAPILLLVLCFREGRRTDAPAWMVTTAEAEWDLDIDESTIARALEALRIPNITRYLKDGYKLQFITPARESGRGTHAVVRLPGGVAAEKICKRRTDLATSLHRAASETWPTVGDEAGILDLWVADKGALAEGAGPYPLLDGGLVDVFKGVPAGRTLRGDAMYVPIIGRNTIVGGAPEQGKSAAARTTMAGVALDPTAELRIWVPVMNFDFERFRPRCARYVRGADEDSIRQIRDDVKELHDEMQRRGDLLDTYELAEVTRKIADANVGLHPIVALLEEAHVAYNHPTYGKEISELATLIVQLGRKYAIHLITSTQAPTANSIPRDITRNCTNGIAFYVGDHTANDALLGQGKYKEGITATVLIPGKDRGTSVTKGFSANRSEIIQWYFLSVAKDNDQVTPLIQRALAAIKERGQSAPTEVQRPQIETRDLLADLAEVLTGNDPVPCADVPALLKRLAPTWTPYQSLTGKSLRVTLAADHGIKVPSTNNRYPLDPNTVRDALAVRTTESETDASDTDDGHSETGTAAS